MRLVAIHQPNFFPWLGYFDKVRQADAFVFLDAVRYPKNTWINRVKLNIGGEARWTTCPVQRGAKHICGAQIDDTRPWRAKLLRTLQTNYSRAENFGPAMQALFPLVTAPESNLAEFNITAIKAIADLIGLRVAWFRQSELPHHGSANELLVSLVQSTGGNAYLLGGGADGYHDAAAFENASIKVVQQNFTQQVYGSEGEFLPGLSVIDWLMRTGAWHKLERK